MVDRSVSQKLKYQVDIKEMKPAHTVLNLS